MPFNFTTDRLAFGERISSNSKGHSLKRIIYLKIPVRGTVKTRYSFKPPIYQQDKKNFLTKFETK